MASDNPEMRALVHETAGAEHAVDLARKDFYPDFSLGVDYIDTGSARVSGIPDSGQDAVLVGISLNIPLHRGKYNAAERAARLRLRSAAQRRQDLGNTLAARAATVLYRLRDAERKIDLYRDALIPKANQSLAATETAYRGGTASFTDFVDAERVLLEFELSFERALADHGQQRAALEQLVGRALPTRDAAKTEDDESEHSGEE